LSFPAPAALRLHRLPGRVLPRGGLDALRQIALCLVGYYGYSLVRGAVWRQDVSAFVNANHVIGLERGLHTFVEPAIQRWSATQHWLITLADWAYLNSQFTVALALLVFIYLRHNRSFYFVRNMFMVAMAMALVLYAVFPTAPPRLLPEWGFTDTVAQLTGVPAENETVNAIFNPYAAIPSMHVAFSLMLGLTLARLVGPRALRALFWAYPAFIIWVVIATGNHFWFDVACGAAVAGSAAWSARRIGQLRPHAWAFAPGVRSAAEAPA